jgi:hypothetical protein
VPGSRLAFGESVYFPADPVIETPTPTPTDTPAINSAEEPNPTESATPVPTESGTPVPVETGTPVPDVDGAGGDATQPGTGDLPVEESGASGTPEAPVPDA